ncbi:MAG: PqqD family protein [Deltaproteobacteria bacterium]|nr:MAG: PqqD family protein [Deltaproteobacteria bacterium]
MRRKVAVLQAKTKGSILKRPARKAGAGPPGRLWRRLSIPRHQSTHPPCGEPPDRARRRLLGLGASALLLAAAPPAPALALGTRVRDRWLAWRLAGVRPLRRGWVRLFEVRGRLFLGYETPWVEINETTRAIWEACDGRRTVAEITRRLAAAHALPPRAVAGDVARAVRALGRAGLLDVASPPRASPTASSHDRSER